MKIQVEDTDDTLGKVNEVDGLRQSVATGCVRLEGITIIL